MIICGVNIIMAGCQKTKSVKYHKLIISVIIVMGIDNQINFFFANQKIISDINAGTKYVMIK